MLSEFGSETTLALESPLSLLEMQTVGSHPKLLNQNLYFNEIPLVLLLHTLGEQALSGAGGGPLGSEEREVGEKRRS